MHITVIIKVCNILMSQLVRLNVNYDISLLFLTLVGQSLLIICSTFVIIEVFIPIYGLHMLLLYLHILE